MAFVSYPLSVHVPLECFGRLGPSTTQRTSTCMSNYCVSPYCRLHVHPCYVTLTLSVHDDILCSDVNNDVILQSDHNTLYTVKVNS